MEIRNLGDVALATITDCFNGSFADYVIPFQVEEEYLRQRWQAARVRYDLSFGVFDGDRLVGFIMTGVDQWKGHLTAFNMATGVIPAYRGQRLVKQIYEVALPIFRKEGISQATLEVITSNEKAIRAYQSVGFVKGRELRSFSGPLALPTEGIYPPFRWRKTAVPRWKKYKDFLPYAPSWELTAEAIGHFPKLYECWELYEADVLRGFFVGKKESGFLSQLGLSPGRWDDLGGILFAQIAQRFRNIKVNNVEATASDLIGLLERRKLKNIINQYEMTMPL